MEALYLLRQAFFDSNKPFFDDYRIRCETITGVLSLDRRLGAPKVCFIGMIAAFLAAEIYCRVTKRGWPNQMPDGVPPAVTKSICCFDSSVVTLTIFLMINAIMTGVFHANLHDVIYELIQKKPLTGLGSSLPATLLALFLVQFLWFFGLHGQIKLSTLSWILSGTH